MISTAEAPRHLGILTPAQAPPGPRPGGVQQGTNRSAWPGSLLDSPGGLLTTPDHPRPFQGRMDPAGVSGPSPTTDSRLARRSMPAIAKAAPAPRYGSVTDLGP